MEIVGHGRDTLKTEYHFCDSFARETQAESKHEGTSDQPKLKDNLLIKWLGIFKSDKVPRKSRKDGGDFQTEGD